MRIIANTIFAEALAHWGAHEAAGRFGGKVQLDTSDKLACVDFVFRYRAPYVSRLLARKLINAYIVQLEPGDIKSIFLADGRSIEAWIVDARNSGGDSYAYFCRMVDDVSLPEGRLVCAARLVDATANKISTVVLYDGWHRAAAWVARIKQGRPTAIDAFLIVTYEEDPLLPRLSCGGGVEK